MSTENIRFRSQIKQVRLAFAKIECQPADKLVKRYQLSSTFLKRLLDVDLLNFSDTAYFRGRRWTAEPTMTLSKFVSIVEFNPLESIFKQPVESSSERPIDSFPLPLSNAR